MPAKSYSYWRRVRMLTPLRDQRTRRRHHREHARRLGIGDSLYFNGNPGDDLILLPRHIPNLDTAKHEGLRTTNNYPRVCTLIIRKHAFMKVGEQRKGVVSRGLSIPAHQQMKRVLCRTPIGRQARHLGSPCPCNPAKGGRAGTSSCSAPGTRAGLSLPWPSPPPTSAKHARQASKQACTAEAIDI